MKKILSLVIIIVYSISINFSQKLISTIELKKSGTFQQDNKGALYTSWISSTTSRVFIKINEKGEIAFKRKVPLKTMDNSTRGISLLISPDGDNNYYSLYKSRFNRKNASKFLYSFNDVGDMEAIDLISIFDKKFDLENITVGKEYVYFLVSGRKDGDKDYKYYSLFKLNHKTKKIEKMASDFHATIDKTSGTVNDLVCVGQTKDFIVFNEINPNSNNIDYHFFRISKVGNEVKEFNYAVDKHGLFPLVYSKSFYDGAPNNYRYSQRTYHTLDERVYKNSEIGDLHVDGVGNVVISGFLYTGNCMEDLREFYYLKFNLANPLEKRPTYTVIKESKDGEEFASAIHHLRIPSSIIGGGFYNLRLSYSLNATSKPTNYRITGFIADGKLENFTYYIGKENSEKSPITQYYETVTDGVKIEIGEKEYIRYIEANKIYRILVQSRNTLKIYSVE